MQINQNNDVVFLCLFQNAIGIVFLNNIFRNYSLLLDRWDIAGIEWQHFMTIRIEWNDVCLIIFREGYHRTSGCSQKGEFSAPVDEKLVIC